MKVQDLINNLMNVDPSLEIRTFGPNYEGKFDLRSVSNIRRVRHKTRLEGDLGPFLMIETSVFDED